MQPNNKEFEFTGTAGDFFKIFLWAILAGLFGIFGAPLAMQKTGKIITSKLKINGRDLTFDVGYWEALKFMFVQGLLVAVTLGIYYFWFLRNSYRFALEHTHFADTAGVVDQTVAVTPPAPTVTPATTFGSTV